MDIPAAMAAVGYSGWGATQYPTVEQLQLVKEKSKDSGGYICFDIRDPVWLPYNSEEKSFSIDKNISKSSTEFATIESISYEMTKAKAKRKQEVRSFTGIQAAHLIMRGGLSCHLVGSLNVLEVSGASNIISRL